MDVPDEYLREIGLVIVLWSRLEHMLNASLILAMTGQYQDPDGRASAVFAHMAIEQKLNALESMLRLIDRGLGEQFSRNILPQISQAKKARNAFVHHLWTGHDGSVHRSNIKARGKIEVEHEEISLKKLIKTAETISKVRDELQTFCLSKITPHMGQ